ncbi:MAG: biopolymer transporter ExbD, partial [Planctomycetales bacterium]|nr:biopolymer transporter ExbD [Planctomycetales bacterium]
MRVRKKDEGVLEGDLTPMIDMTFQLIAFFMVLVNFSDAEQDQRIKLPSSELAKPPDAPFEEPRYLQLTKDDTVLFAGDEVGVDALEPVLQREKAV